MAHLMSSEDGEQGRRKDQPVCQKTWMLNSETKQGDNASKIVLRNE